jgi:hypothetical protein
LLALHQQYTPSGCRRQARASAPLGRAPRVTVRPLDITFISRTRRHHALEHATISLLNQRYPNQRLVGWSTPGGFYIYGNVPTPAVESSASSALERLRRGERHLAVHPRCGTNLVTAGTLVGLFSFLVMLPGDDRSRRGRFPLVVMLSTLILMLAQPLGLAVQEWITTDSHFAPEASPLVTSGTAGNTPVHKVQIVHKA